MITFSYALLLFVAILGIVYFMLLWYDDKLRISERHPRAKIANFAMFGAYVSMFLLIIFQRLWNTSLFYFLLYPIAVFLFLFTLIWSSDASRAYLLVSVVLLHVIALSIIFPSFGIMITERTPAIVKLDEAKAWDPSWQMLNSYYNPFPLDLGLSYTFSQITGIEYTNLLSAWIIALFFVIAYDLTLFSFAREISGSWRVGVLSVLLLTFTPPLILNPQPQWLANLFILVFLTGLFKALKNSPSISNIILINLSYAAAILLHGTAAIGIVFVSVLFVLMLFGRRFGVNVATTSQHRSYVYVISLSIYLMTLGKWVVLGGIEPVMNPLMGLVKDILGYGEVGWIGSQYVPLYDQFVSPIGAYAWSVPVSLAFAFILYQLVNRSQRKSLDIVFISSMGVAAVGLAFAGFVGSVFMAHANLQRYLGYAGMSFFVPVAAVVCLKILHSFSWKIMSIGLISIVLFSGIGICDPAFSPQLYHRIKTVSPTGSADLLEGRTLYAILSERTYIVSTYEILTAIWYLTITPESSGKAVHFYAGSLKTHRIVAEQLLEEKEVKAGVTYVWTSEVLEVSNETLLNVVYNSGRHVAVGQGG